MSVRELKRRIRYLLRGDQSLPGIELDGVRVVKRNTGFLDDGKFSAAWRFAEEGNREAWAKLGYVPDVRWRAHVCCWAASNASRLDGDFAEFGVNAGLFSMTICRFLDFASMHRKFYLFDTYEGIPTDGLIGREKNEAIEQNARLYTDVFEIAKRNFSPFSNAILVQGFLPASIDTVPLERIAYLSVDLNSAQYEKQSIEKVWDRLVRGAHIVLDDYAFKRHQDQYEMWNAFAAERGHMVLTLPTGQGLMIKH